MCAKIDLDSFDLSDEHDLYRQPHYWTFLRLGEKPVYWNAVPE
jgi:hypothetical protein